MRAWLDCEAAEGNVPLRFAHDGLLLMASTVRLGSTRRSGDLKSERLQKPFLFFVRKGTRRLVLSSELTFCSKTTAIEDRFGAIVLKKSASRLFPEFSIKTNGYLRYAFAVADRSISISVPPAWMYLMSSILTGVVAVLR